MTERQLINAIKKAVSSNSIDYNVSKLKESLHEDPDDVYDAMIDFSRSHDTDSFLILAEEVVAYEKNMLETLKESSSV